MRRCDLGMGEVARLVIRYVDSGADILEVRLSCAEVTLRVAQHPIIMNGLIAIHSAVEFI